MRQIININNNWKFQLHGQSEQDVNIPHTWNNVDGQDGGNDYLRTVATYSKNFETPAHIDSEDVFLEFNGVNSECQIFLNGSKLYEHAGGYSTFRVNITEHLTEENHLEVVVDNRPNDRVYPQKADFTFYGGIYRDVNLLVVDKDRFDMDYYGGNGVAIEAKPDSLYRDATVKVRTWRTGEKAEVQIEILDKYNHKVDISPETIRVGNVSCKAYGQKDHTSFI